MTMQGIRRSVNILRGAYLASKAGIIGTTVALFTIYFLFPLGLPAYGVWIGT